MIFHFSCSNSIVISGTSLARETKKGAFLCWMVPHSLSFFFHLSIWFFRSAALLFKWSKVYNKITICLESVQEKCYLVSNYTQPTHTERPSCMPKLKVSLFVLGYSADIAWLFTQLKFDLAYSWSMSWHHYFKYSGQVLVWCIYHNVLQFYNV